MSDSDYIDVLNSIGISLNRYGNPTICVIGNIGNLLSFIVFLKKSWKKNVCVFYFLIYILFGTINLNTVILGTAFITGFKINLLTSSLVLCKVFFYLAYTVPMLYASVLILASIDRLLISSQKVDTRLYSSKRLAYFSLSISSVFWMFFMIHVLVKISILQYGPTIITCYYDSSLIYRKFIAFSSMAFNCLLCLLMIILSIFSFKNVRYIRSIPRRERGQVRTMTKKDFQLIRCLFAQDIVYILLTVPVNLCSVYIAATAGLSRTPLEDAITSFIQSFLNFLYYSLYCTTFFVLFSVSKAFRNEIKRIVYQIFNKDLTAISREEKNQEELVKDPIELNVVSNSAVLPP